MPQGSASLTAAGAGHQRSKDSEDGALAEVMVADAPTFDLATSIFKTQHTMCVHTSEL